MSDNIRAAERVMKQTAVYWEKTGDNANAEPEYAPAVEVKCRWVDVHEVYVDKDGHDVVSQAKVLVDRDMIPDSQIILGEIKDLDNPSDPSDNDGHYRIGRFEKIPDRRGTKFLRRVML